jgi:hypothetical protein
MEMATSYIRRYLVWTRQSGLEIGRVRTCVFHCGILWGWKAKFVPGNCERSTWVCTVDDEDIRSSGPVQVNDGLYAEVPLWCASRSIARRRIDLVCLEALWLQEWVWVLADCHKRSCWKNSVRVGVPRPCGSDVYVCSESCRLCFTVVYWLLEFNKVP